MKAKENITKDIVTLLNKIQRNYNNKMAIKRTKAYNSAEERARRDA